MIKIANIKIKGKIFLAPMAGVTDCCFRKLVTKLGANYCYTPLISNLGLRYNSKNTMRIADIKKKENTSVQIFGGDVEDYVWAAKYFDKHSNAKMIDLNVGCPVRKVSLKSRAGSFLLTDIKKLEEIIQSIKKVIKKPLTMKMRIGWDKESRNYLSIINIAQKAGIDLIAVHARTRDMMFSGKADWSVLKKIKLKAKVPIIGNGDIKTPFDAKRMLDETNVDGIMIGRSARDNPFLIKQISDYLKKGYFSTEISKNQIINFLKKFFVCLVKENGEKLALLKIRPFVSKWLKKIKGYSLYKEKLFFAKTKKEFLCTLKKLKST